MHFSDIGEITPFQKHLGQQRQTSTEQAHLSASEQVIHLGAGEMHIHYVPVDMYRDSYCQIQNGLIKEKNVPVIPFCRKRDKVSTPLEL